jgi:hypothetical protein
MLASLAEQCLLVLLESHQSSESLCLLCYAAVLQVQGCAVLQQGVPDGSMATAQAGMQGTAAPAAA